MEFHDVHKIYRVAGREIPALQSTHLNIQAGQIFGPISHSSAGKSTLLRLINHLEGPNGGRTLVEDKGATALDVEGLRRFRQRVGMIFQHFNLLSSKTVAGNIVMPPYLAGGFSRAEVDARVFELFVRVGLSDHVRKYPAQLSGERKQRVDITRALVYRPGILLYDETISALDLQTTVSALQLSAEINHELKLIIALVVHEMGVVHCVCDQVAIMDGDAITKQGDVADIFLHSQHPATRRFVFEAEWVGEDERHDDLAHVPGFILRLTSRGEAIYVPLLGTVARQTGVDYSILSGRIDRIKDVSYGQLTLALVGGDLEITMDQLNAVDIYVEIPR